MNSRDDINLWEVLHRHRFGLGPFYMGGAVAGTAALYGALDLSAGQAWTATAALSVTGATWMATRMRDRWRRFYAYGTLTASASWVMTAHELVPDPISFKWAGIALLSGTVVGGIPWWTSDVRRRQVRMEENLRDWPKLARRIGKIGLNMSNVVGTVTGPKGRLTWASGLYEVDEIISAKSRIEGALGAQAGSLRMTKEGRSTNSVEWRIVERDPHALPQEWQIPDHVGSASDPLAVGPFESERIARIHRFEPTRGVRHMLLGGTSDAGKSSLVRLSAVTNICTDDVFTIGMDFKGGVELGPLKEALGAYTTSKTWAHELLCAIAAEGGLLDMRGAHLEKAGRKIWNPKIDGPIIDITVDEAKELLGEGTPARVVAAFSSIANKGRALGVRFLLATQYPTLEAIGSSQVRQQIRHRFCFRMEDDTGEGYVLQDTVRADLIPADRPGTCYMRDGSETFTEPLRVYWISDETERAVVQARRGLTAELDEGSEAAIVQLFPAFAERERWVSPEVAAANAAAGVSGNDSGNDGSADMKERNVSGSEGAANSEADSDPDVGLADMIEARRERMTQQERDQLDREREVAVTVPVPRGSEADATEVMLRALREAGETGIAPKELQRLAGRSSSWFYPIANRLADDGVIKRTKHGTWAIVPTEAQQVPTYSQ
jgi:S-DNA-T family DNA segregation ATPase FtsK/SpoIIIE